MGDTSIFGNTIVSASRRLRSEDRFEEEREREREIWILKENAREGETRGRSGARSNIV